MKIKSAEFIISAVGSEQFPEDRKPEIAFAGRSNVGKSSFLNKLVNMKNFAKISSTPGKTRMINFFEINGSFRFVDLPGYGYASVSKKMKRDWSELIESYLRERDFLRCVVHLIDIRHDPTELDVLMYDWLKSNEIPVIIVATKIDKISKGKRKSHLEAISAGLGLIDNVSLLHFSAKTGEGKENIWEAISMYLN